MANVSCYSVYALILFTIAYLLNQLDRYLLAVLGRSIAQDLQYGDLACQQNQSFPKETFTSVTCNATKREQCEQISVNGTNPCVWDYNGQGFQYQVLAGPIFIVVFTFSGIPIGFAADKYKRVLLFAIAISFWSLMTIFSGHTQEYWQFALTRFLLGVGSAGCTPFATSLIADLFSEQSRASALGIYNLGIYIGYSMSYAIGNFIAKANILGQGWRWAFYISGMPGLILGPVMYFSIKEPQRASKVGKRDDPDEDIPVGYEDESAPLIAENPSAVQNATFCQKLREVGREFCKPTLLMLCVAGSIRNGAGYTWAYNTQPYYESIGEDPTTIGSYMSWIPLAAGSVGVVLGGFLSDRVVKRIGPKARLMILVGSQLLASPFVAGALFLSTPAAYYSLIPGYIIGEMWVGITLAVAVEVIPVHLRTSAVALYLFIITNIGGNMPLLVPPIQNSFAARGYSPSDSLRAALYIMYPGMYVLGAILFLVTLGLLHMDLKKVKTPSQD